MIIITGIIDNLKTFLVEDPQTGIDDIDRYIRRSDELVEACRAYLRGAREKLESMDNN